MIEDDPLNAFATCLDDLWAEEQKREYRFDFPLNPTATSDGVTSDAPGKETAADPELDPNMTRTQ
jgi:hypothetical protein